MARECGAKPTLEQFELIVEPDSEFLDPQRGSPGRSQLDRQGYAVEPTTDRANRRQCLVARSE